MVITFDSAKDARNRRRHGISLQRAEAFHFDSAFVLLDDSQDYGEIRMPAKRNDFSNDNPEWTADRLARAKPFRQVFPGLDTSSVVVRSEPVSPASRQESRIGEHGPEEQIVLPLSADVVAGLRETGPGWTALADELLREGLRRRRDAAAKPA